MRSGELLFTFLPATLLVLGPLSYGVWRAWYAYTQFGPAAASAWARPWFLLATLALLPLTLLALARLASARRSVAVYEHGLRLRLSPFRRQFLPWERIAGIAVAGYQEHFLGPPLNIRPVAVIYPAHERPVRLDGRLQGVAALAKQVKAILYPRLLGQLRADLKAGRRISFNRVAISLDGLAISGRRIPWERVARLGVQAGFLVVELDTGARLRQAVAHIPNLEILLQLVELDINR
jgi:hypothetical protein